MKQEELLCVLDSVDSTNNYAMAAIHAGLAKPEMGWFAREQTSGKGQRGKEWTSEPGKNIMMSVVLKPEAIFAAKPFYFNALIANTCLRFLSKYFGGDLTIKWPNDLFFGDRKTGGILIENIFSGHKWNWSVVGIGINVNQVFFPQEAKNAISLKKVTGLDYDVVKLAEKLHRMIIKSCSAARIHSLPGILKVYNDHLYMRTQTVKLRKENIVFNVRVDGVSGYGQLITTDGIEKTFEFGQVEWILPDTK